VHLKQEDAPLGFVNFDDAGLVQEQGVQIVDQIVAGEQQVV
jgi:hypothetical protein